MAEVYVDDILISAETVENINEIKSFLEKNFKMKDLKEVKKFLGMNINQTTIMTILCLHITQYHEKKIQRSKFVSFNCDHYYQQFGMIHDHRISTTINVLFII